TQRFRALAHPIRSSGRAELDRATVSCASPTLDGPRSVELASSDANGPVMTAGPGEEQPAVRPDAQTRVDAAMSAVIRRRISAIVLVAFGYVPAVFAGLGLRRRRRQNTWRELIR